MATFSADTFTGSAGTNIAGTTGTVGSGAWTAGTSSTGSVVISDANRARNGTANTVARLYKNDTPADADYSVYADMFVVTTADICRPGVIGRMSSSADTSYIFRFNNGAWNLHRRVTGTATNLAADVPVTLTIGNTYRIELRMVGDQITGYVDGVATIGPITDANITATGFPGLYEVAVLASNTTDVHHDFWFADDVPGGNGAGGGAQDTPELYGRPFGHGGQAQMQQLLAR